MAAVLPSLNYSRLPVFQLVRLRFISIFPSFSFSSSVSRDSHSMIEYLVNTCGLSAAEAAKASKHLSHLRSTKKPDAVLTFMKSQGFGAAHLRRMICLHPTFLCSDVEKTLAPKLQSLRDFGFSESHLVDFLSSEPGAINFNVHRGLLPKLKFWESILGSRERFLKHAKRKWRFLSFSIEKVVRPNLTFLRDECGIPEERVSLVLRMNTSFIVLRPDSLRTLVLRADALGIPRQSKMFLWILNFLHLVNEERYEAKVKFMKNFGWSDSEFSAAVVKFPSFLCLSEGMLRRKMDFLVNQIGFTPLYIAHRPALLMYSLEKRVIPRFHVIEMLKSKGIWTPKQQLYSFYSMSNAKFMERFVTPYKEKVPQLLGIM
ncbi:hypothetical protein Cni_G17408 [Canna indica]|uniref:Uncharacterized protein n=1 Tax=Canna indica TaxID=4628 RepID=A0AAQ3QHQ7_9LILI|nr:hypothetical protein Cni_G17408 [Canna indica]